MGALPAAATAGRVRRARRLDARLDGPAFATAQRLRQAQRDQARAKSARARSTEDRIAAIRREQEQAWQRWVAEKRQQDPAAAPPSTPDLARADAYDEVQQQIRIAVTEAARAYREPDRQALPAYVQYHAAQAHDRALTTLRKNLGIDVSNDELADQLAVAGPIDPATLPPELEGPVDLEGAVTPESGGKGRYRVTVDDVPDEGRHDTAAQPVKVAPASDAAPRVVTLLAAPAGSEWHEQAAAAAPRAPGYVTLVAHSRNGAVLDGGAELGPAEVAARLGLHVAGTRPDGTPRTPPENPVGVIMLADDLPQAGADLHALTGGAHLVLTQTARVMVRDGEAISGTVAGDTFRADGEWLAHVNGQTRRTGTASLNAALALLAAGQAVNEAHPSLDGAGPPVSEAEPPVSGTQPDVSGGTGPANGAPAPVVQLAVSLPGQLARLTSARVPALPEPGVTWLRAPHDSLVHAQAAAAAPHAPGFVTLVAHSRNRRVVDGDTELTGPQLASRLGLHVAGTMPDGTRRVPPENPIGVIMLSCNPPEAAVELHQATGFAHPVLFPSSRSIIMPTGEVIAGTFTRGNDGKSKPDSNGEWLALINGQLYDLGTARLSEAADALGIGLMPGAEPPARPVAFYADLSEDQTAVLNDAGLVLSAPAQAGSDGADGFFNSLITVAPARLSAELRLGAGQRLTPRLVREHMANYYGRNSSQYQDFLPESITSDQVRRELAGPYDLDWRFAQLLKQLGADAFRLDLAVLGANGQLLSVGRAGLHRAAGPNHNPFLLVQATDGQFAATLPRAGVRPGSLRPTPRPAPAADKPTAWLEEFGDPEKLLISQEADAAPLPPETGRRPAAAGRVAEMRHLAPIAAPRRAERIEPIITELTRDIEDMLTGRLDPGRLPTILPDLEALQRIHLVISSAGATQRRRELEQEYQRAIGAPQPGQSPAEHAADLRMAQDAAYAAVLAGRAGEISTQRQAAVPAANRPVWSIGTRLEDARRTVLRTAANAERAAQAESEERPTVDVEAAVTAATETAVREVLTDLAREIGDLAGARQAEQHAALFDPSLPTALLEATIAKEDAEQALRPLRDAARDFQEWQARRRQANTDAEHGLESLELPVNWGALVRDENGQVVRDDNGREVRRYPLGHQGRFVRIGDAPLSDTARVARQLVSALPQQDQNLAAEAEALLVKFIHEEGRHELTRRLLAGRLTLRIGDRAVNFTLGLGDLRTAFQVRTGGAEGLPIGAKRHHPVEGETQVSSGTRRTVGNARTGTLNFNVATPSGFLPGGAWSVNAGVAVTGVSTVDYTSGSDIVTAIKLAPRYEHLSAYFDFPMASIQTVVTGGATQGRRLGRADLTARAGFPEEIAPVKHADDPTAPDGAFRDTPRVLPGSRRLGVSQRELDQSRAAGPARAAAAAETAKKTEEPLHHALNMPESAADLTAAADFLLARLGARGRDRKVADAVREILGEPWFLKRYVDVTTPGGALSPPILDSDGRVVGYLRVQTGLRTVQASNITKLGLKEEVQRFVSVWDQKSQGGGMALSANLGAGHVLGDPTAALGGFSNISFGADVTASVSSTRSQDVNTGSGDIRGNVIWGNSVLYLADFLANVTLITDDGREVSHQSNHPVNLLIPEMQRDRFEHKLKVAAGENVTGPEPVDDEPDLNEPEEERRRYPPAVMDANQGIGFSSALEMPGGEYVLPRIMEMIKEADGPLTWAKPWNAADEVRVEAQLSSRFSLLGLKAHIGALSQPGGTRMQVYRPARNGVELITVTVEATHDTEVAAQGRIASSTLEVMPSAFAGNAGTDEIGAGVGGFVQAAASIGRGSNGSEPRAIGPSVRLGGQFAQTAETTSGVTGFTLQANLYGPDPAIYIRYGNVTYKIRVDVRHQKHLTPSLLHWAGAAVRDGLSRLAPTRTAARPARPMAARICRAAPSSTTNSVAVSLSSCTRRWPGKNRNPGPRSPRSAKWRPSRPTSRIPGSRRRSSDCVGGGCCSTRCASYLSMITWASTARMRSTTTRTS